VIFVFEPELAIPGQRRDLGGSSHGPLTVQGFSIEVTTVTQVFASVKQGISFGWKSLGWMTELTARTKMVPCCIILLED